MQKVRVGVSLLPKAMLRLIAAPLLIATPLLTGCASTGKDADKSISHNANASEAAPASQFDLSHWKITVPLDNDNNGKVDEVNTKALLAGYRHPDFFYLDHNGHLVFQSPNKAITTQTSSNTRSELRQMIRGTDTSVGTKSYANNFSLAAHPDASLFNQVGGSLAATLKVNHVAKSAKYAKKPAYSVVVGQIHAGKDKQLLAEGQGFGWGNEPIKIYYKKWPNHQTGSVFWNYERNLAKDDPARTDISYPVWGNTWENPADPQSSGIALGESFSYRINVYKNVMYLTFTHPSKATVNYQIDLTNNIDAYGKVDSKDHPKGYAGDWHYFKAGAYNQCSTKQAKGIWYAGCAGTGDWKIDKANGDYTSVTFSKLTLGNGFKPDSINM